MSIMHNAIVRAAGFGAATTGRTSGAGTTSAATTSSQVHHHHNPEKKKTSTNDGAVDRRNRENGGGGSNGGGSRLIAAPADGRRRGRWPLSLSFYTTMLRILLLDAPYLMLVLAVVLSRIALHYHDVYLLPQLDLLAWSEDRAANEVTYYKRICTTADQSTHDPRDLLLNDDDEMSAEDMVDVMLRHGVAVLPDLLAMETATALRETILQHNTMEENYWILSHEHRHSYGIRMEQHPVVRTAVREIATNERLRRILPGLMGDEHPALIKFHAITARYGAADQPYHWDVRASASAVAYARSFAPLYSLFVPLQHTPLAMGPTQMCPGSHVCSAGIHFCKQTALPILFADLPPNATTTNEPVWPATYGALMNQQTIHRGMAHTWENGPDRVMLIIAISPRPRSTEHISLLETRALSMGGSHALHWTQWGHTWSDLHGGTMYDPVKTLKSLGVYKPPHTQWGRDWITTVLLRMANGAYSNRSQLQTHLRNGALWYVPKIFHYELPEDYEMEEDEDLVWYYFFYGTFRNVTRWIPVVTMILLVLYTFGYTWVQLVAAVLQGRGLAPVLANARAYGVRMLWWHGAALSLFVFWRHYLDRQPWSRHIRQRKLYTSPTSFPSHPVLPSTLPVPDDVLLLDDFQSDYLASYTRLFEVAHPGNARWKRRLATAVGSYHHRSSYFYPDMPASVQAALQDSLIHQVEREGRGRFLQKNLNNQWARMTRQDAKVFVHQELLRSSNDGYDVLLREVAYRRSETKFGPWRDSALHLRHIPCLLTTLVERLSGGPRAVTTAAPLSKAARSLSNPRRINFRREPVFLVPTGLSAPMVSSSGVGSGNDDDNAMPRGPFHGAWLQVGDRVDALYSESETYWYPGTIVEAKAHSNKWVIVYDYFEGSKEVCRYCVWPLKPLEVDDTVEVSFNSKFYPGALQAVHGVDSFDFVFSDTPHKVFRNLEMQKYRRPLPDFGDPEQMEYDLGEPVFALYYDNNGKADGTYIAAMVVAIEYPQTNVYTILYANSDEIYGVRSRDLRPMTYYVE